MELETLLSIFFKWRGLLRNTITINSCMPTHWVPKVKWTHFQTRTIYLDGLRKEQKFLSRLIINEGVELVMKNLPTEERSQPDGVTC